VRENGLSTQCDQLGIMLVTTAVSASCWSQPLLSMECTMVKHAETYLLEN